MWKLLHKLFGWHYVHLRNSATEIIRRVHHTADKKAYAKYFTGHLIFLDRGDGWTVTPLTYPSPCSIPEGGK